MPNNIHLTTNNRNQDQDIKTHIGPFNTQCIFVDSPKILIGKILGYLIKNSIRHSEPEQYNILMADG